MTTLTVIGMSCGGCEATVVEALADVEGVTSARADHETDTVAVEGDADDAALVQAVQDAGGYDVPSFRRSYCSSNRAWQEGQQNS